MAKENCALLGCYSACPGNFLETFREKSIVPDFKGQESDRLSRNVDKEFPPHAM